MRTYVLCNVQLLENVQYKRNVCAAITAKYLQVRLQTQSSTNPIYSGTADCVRKTVSKEGPRALYKGELVMMLEVVVVMVVVAVVMVVVIVVVVEMVVVVVLMVVMTVVV